MNLYVRHRQGIWITFVHDVSEFKDLITNYIPGRRIVIGDIAQFNNTMMNMLLKFIEENHDVDIYSSEDVLNPILLSRILQVYKQPLTFQEAHSLDRFMESDRTFLASKTLLSRFSNERKIRAALAPMNLLKIMNSI